MKITNYFAVAFAGLLFLGGCKKSGGDSNLAPEVPKTLKYLSRIVHTVGTATDFTDYAYDVKNRLASVKIGGSITVNYTYDGDNLFSIDSRSVSGTNVARNYYEFAYQNGALKSGTRKIYANDVLSRDYTFDYSVVNGEVTQTTQNPGAIVSSYTYANNNLATSTSAGTTVTYSYDTQKSIFINAPAKYFTPGEGRDRFSKNNVTKSVSSGGTTVDYTYTYDADGYPVTAIAGQDRYTHQYVIL